MTELTQEQAKAHYPAILGLRDTDKGLEMAVMLDDRAPHPEGSPHMIVMNWLRAHWSQVIAAAELEHIMSTARATVDRIEEAGGLHKAASAG